MIVWLIRNGADVNAANTFGYVPHQNMQYRYRTGRVHTFFPDDYVNKDLIVLFDDAQSPLSPNEVIKRATDRHWESVEWHRRNPSRLAGNASYANDRIGGSASGLIRERGKPIRESIYETPGGSTRTLTYGDARYNVRGDNIESIFRADTNKQ
jgi:hypothetical protein